jgi:hypothetical protein
VNGDPDQNLLDKTGRSMGKWMRAAVLYRGLISGYTAAATVLSKIAMLTKRVFVPITQQTLGLSG